MAKDIVKKTIRLKKELCEKVAVEAEKMGISVNAYIIMTLSKEVEKKNY